MGARLSALCSARDVRCGRCSCRSAIGSVCEPPSILCSAAPANSVCLSQFVPLTGYRATIHAKALSANQRVSSDLWRRTATLAMTSSTSASSWPGYSRPASLGDTINSGRRAGRGSLISTLLWRTQLRSPPMTGTLNKRASFVVRLPIGIIILFLVGPVETLVVSLLVS